MDREETFLNSFFTFVSQLNFDKVKELVEKEKESSNLQSTPWNMLQSLLYQFAAAEKSYVELGFFSNRQKSFLRKDNSLRACYEQLRYDFHKLEDLSKHNKTVLDVASQLSHFMLARVELIDFYEKIQAVGTTKPIRFIDLLGLLEELAERHLLTCPHVTLTKLKESLSLECEILVHLVKAAVELTDWRYLSSLMLLNGATNRLQVWEHTLISKESWRLGSFLTQKLPPLHQWLTRFKGSLCAKFAILFFNTLSEQTSPSDFKALCTKLSPAPDYHTKFHTFQHKSGAIGLLIIFDSFGVGDFEGGGYKIPPQNTSRSSPIQSSPSPPPLDSPTSAMLDPRFFLVYSSPSGADIYMQDIVCLSIEKAMELSALDKVVFNYNLMDNRSLFCINFDSRFTLALLFSGRKTEKDNACVSFLTEMASHLRGNKILTSLKPGAK